MAVPADTLPGGRGAVTSARFGGFAYGWEVGLLVVMALLYLVGTAINPRFFGDLTALPLLSMEKKRIGSMLMLEDISSEKRMRSTMSRSSASTAEATAR